MFTAAVQADSGRHLLVQRSDGRAGGKPILSFIMAALSYCDGKSKDEETAAGLREFDRIPTSTRRSLCLACALLMQSLVNTQWDYREGEDYETYVSRTGDKRMSREAFLAGASYYQQAWTEIELLIARVQTVISILLRVYLPEDAYLLAYDVLLDFSALHDTLVVLQQVGVRRARIDIH